MVFEMKYVVYAIVGIVALIFIILLLGRPAPELAGPGCEMERSYPTIIIECDDDFTNPCPDDCCIINSTYEGDGKCKIYCECFDCEQTGDTSQELGDCAYGNPFFDWLGQAMGFCIIPTED